MRIISGQFKGRKLLACEPIRPTEDKVKKALFDILMNVVPKSRFLDLYAGSGAVGIEALSWGARQVYFVEQDSKFSKIIEENVAKLKIDSELCSIMTLDADRAIERLHSLKKKFDLVFMDPPYYKGAPRLPSASTGSAFTLSERSESKGSGSASPKESESLAPRPGSTSLTTSGSGSTLDMDTKSLAKKTLQTLGAYDIVCRNGLVIVQHHRRDELASEYGQLKLWRAKKYSTTILSFYTK